jgi:hypothetical protein
MGELDSAVVNLGSLTWALKTKLHGLVCNRIILTERAPHVSEVTPAFADRGCRVVSATDSHGC